MPNINQVIFGGHLGADAEVRYITNGKAVCNFSVASTSKYNDKEFTEWAKIVAWGKLAEVCGTLQKGDGVVITGRLQTRSWEDKDGIKRYITEIVAFTVTKQLETPQVQSNPEHNDYGQGNDSDFPF